MATSTLNVQRPVGSNPIGRVGKVKPQISDIYQATLIVKRDGRNIVNLSTPLPENYQFSLSSNFDTPFNQPLSDLMGGASGAKISKWATQGSTAVTGMTTMWKYFSGAVWTGGSALQLTIPFVLQAYEDPKTEVLMPMKKLMQAVAPSEYGTMLRAPGPHVLNNGETGLLGGDDITVKIGRFFKLNPCIITNVDESFDTQFDHNGDPLGVVINVSILSYFTTTKEDLDKWFQGIPNTETDGTESVAGAAKGATSAVGSAIGGVFGF